MKLLTFALPLALGGCASSIAAESSGDMEVPLDVSAYIHLKNQCDDWQMAVNVGDPRTPRFMNDISRECRGLDQRLEMLRKKYAVDAKIMDMLEFYEDEKGSPSDPRA